MDAKLRQKRIEILKKIDVLSTKCNCVSAQDSIDCPNCKKVSLLGQKLIKLVRPRSAVSVDISNRDYPENRKKQTVFWTKEMVSYIKKNAHKYTYKELTAIMKVPEHSLRTKCSDLGHKCKRLSVKYHYYENDILITTGFIPDIARQTGLNESTLRNYAYNKRKNTKRRMVKVDES